MRYIGAGCPPFGKVLVVESGARTILEAALPRLSQVFGNNATFDLFTCYSGAPTALAAEATIWRTQNYGSSETRRQLLNDLRAAGINGVAIVCSGESIMTRWKWWLAWNLPAKVLIVNENADAFWLDRSNLSVIRRFASERMGLRGDPGGKTMGRILVFPFALAYLLLYATIAHARRAVRLAFAARNP